MCKRTMELMFLFAVLTGGWLWAAMEVSSSVEVVPARGNHLLGGSLVFVISGDDFATASPESPIYVRVVLDDNIRLSDSHVDPLATDPILASPIYIPLRVGTSDGPKLIAPADTLSVVYWRAGSRDLWLRVQRSTGGWLEADGATLPPSEDKTVGFYIGLASSLLVDIEPERKNLPFYTRNPLLGPEVVDLTEGEDLWMCVDLTGSSLSAQDIAGYYIEAFGPGSRTESGVFKPIDPYDLDASGGYRNIRVMENSCTMAASPVLPTILPVATDDAGWGVHSRSISFQGGCVDRPESTRYGDLLPGGGLQLTLSGSGYGFDENSILFDEELLPAELVLLEPFTLRERTLYRKARLSWKETSEVPTDFSIELKVIQDMLAEMEDLVVLWSFDLIRSTASYVFCNNGIYSLAQGSWHLAQPAAPVGNQIIPHLTRASGGFTTHIVVTNADTTAETVHLTTFNELGQPLKSVSLEVPPEQTYDYATEVLFGSGDHAWLAIAQQGTLPVTAVYRADRPGSTPAAVVADSQASRSYRLFPGNGVTTWDGLALVNAGSNPALVEIQQKNHEGAVLATRTLQPGAREKMRYILEDGFTYGDGHYFDIISSEPLYLTALRGDRDSNFLWTVALIQLED